MPSKRITIPRNPTPREAIAVQNKLASLVSQESDLPEQIRHIAGTDVAYENEKASGAAVLIAYDTLEQIETATVKARTTFPYIPGLLSFREGPVAVQALRKHLAASFESVAQAIRQANSSVRVEAEAPPDQLVNVGLDTRPS